MDTTGYVEDLVRCIGRGAETPQWLRGALAKEIDQRSAADDRRFAYEGIAIASVPLTLEPLTLPPFEDPFPPSNAAVVAMNLVGLFNSRTLGPTLSGSVPGRSYVFDLNTRETAVYRGRQGLELPEGLDGYVVLADGSMDSVAGVRQRWLSIQALALDPANRESFLAAARSFFDDHPGLARAQELPRRVGLEASTISDPVPVPQHVLGIYDFALALAPVLLAHSEGRVPFGAAADLAMPAFDEAAHSEHQQSIELVRFIGAWCAGRSEHAHFREALVHSERPITKRWLARLS